MFIYRSQYAVWETAQSHDVVPVESPLAMLDKTNAVNKSKQVGAATLLIITSTTTNG